MAIIGALPNNIQNGQLADAVPVMADFNFIVNQVNANAAPLGTLTAPSGTRMVFNQAAAPLGWTQDVAAAFTDTALRIVATAGGGTGGATPLSNWISGGTFNVNAFTLSVAQLPPHTHGGNGNGFWCDQPGTFVANAGGTDIQMNRVPNTMSTGSGASITPSYTTPSVKYTDCIIGVKT